MPEFESHGEAAAAAVDFSIIVPTFNRPGLLADCLGAIAAMRAPGVRFEVIVVDDGGAAPLDGVVAPFRGCIDLTLLRRSNGGPAAARNSGAGQARGRFLAFVDDDCRPVPDWLENLHARLSLDPKRLAGGRLVNLNALNDCSAASMALIAYLYEYYESAGRGGFFSTANLTVPADGFRRLGGFDESYRIASEDRDFCARWMAAGLAVGYARDAIAYHNGGGGFVDFCRRHFTYGRGAVQFHQGQARDGRGGVRVEPSRFYSSMLRYPFSQSDIRHPLAVSALMALSQAANAAGFLYQRALRSGKR